MTRVVEEIAPGFAMLMGDPVGNYFCQALLDVTPKRELEILVPRRSGDEQEPSTLGSNYIELRVPHRALVRSSWNPQLYSFSRAAGFNLFSWCFRLSLAQRSRSWCRGGAGKSD